MTLLFEVFCLSFCLLSQTFASTAVSSLNHLTLLFFPIFPCILNDVDGRFNLSKTRKAPNQPILPCFLKYVKYSTSSWEKQIYRARAPAFQKLHPAVHLSFLLWVLFVLEIDFIISKKKKRRLLRQKRNEYFSHLVLLQLIDPTLPLFTVNLVVPCAGASFDLILLSFLYDSPHIISGKGH